MLAKSFLNVILSGVFILIVSGIEIDRFRAFIIFGVSYGVPCIISGFTLLTPLVFLVVVSTPAGCLISVAGLALVTATMIIIAKKSQS